MVDHGYQGETRQWDIDRANEEARESAYYRGEQVKELQDELRRANATISYLVTKLKKLTGEEDVITLKAPRLPFDPK